MVSGGRSQRAGAVLIECRCCLGCIGLWHKAEMRMSLMAYRGRCYGLSEVKQGDIWQVSWRGIGRSGLSGAALGWQGNRRWREMTEPVGRLVIRAVASLGDAGI